MRILPDVIAHADWSTDPKKRWLTVAVLKDDYYVAAAPEPVGHLATFVERLSVRSGVPGRLLAGFDFPIGLPEAYAARAGITDFPDALRQFGTGVWQDFYHLSDRPDEVSVHRPFFPDQSNEPGREQAQLTAGIGVQTIEQLLRRCELPTSTRGRACCVFWTLGGNQVGRAAIAGWQELICPTLERHADRFGLWPFQGDISTLTERHPVVFVETYPADVFARMGFPRTGTWSKRQQQDRRARGVQILAWKAAVLPAVVFEDALVAQINDGFGAAKTGEDKFDSVIGLLGMLDVVVAGRSEGAIAAPPISRLEGWIFGQN